MKKKQIITLVIAVALFIITGVSSVLTNALAENSISEEMEMLLFGDVSITLPTYDYIAIVDVVGTIQEQTADMEYLGTGSYLHTTTMEYIDSVMYDDYNQGILLYVDSPGGTVYESEELYSKLVEYKEVTGRPVWVYMAHYAASGGYYVSAPADMIYANRNTTTGSIGVIMSGYDLTGLYEKLGIRYVSITSGDYKDSSTLNEEQIAIYQSQVDESYHRFVEIVAEGRGMSVDQVKTLADGRTYTALQALDNGLIDKISTYEEMQQQMCDELGVYDFYSMPDTTDPFAKLFMKLEDLVPKSEAQILSETAAEMESGVLMYYAK